MRSADSGAGKRESTGRGRVCPGEPLAACDHEQDVRHECDESAEVVFDGTPELTNGLHLLPVIHEDDQQSGLILGNRVGCAQRVGVEVPRKEARKEGEQIVRVFGDQGISQMTAVVHE